MGERNSEILSGDLLFMACICNKEYLKQKTDAGITFFGIFTNMALFIAFVYSYTLLCSSTSKYDELWTSIFPSDPIKSFHFSNIFRI